MAPLVDLQVLQSGKTPTAVCLAALERSLSCVNPQVGHQLVLGVEGLGVTGTVLEVGQLGGLSGDYSIVLTLQ